ncbi:RNA polymerase II transcription regulator recruiting protein [Aureococcus anophagefferens]|nr:RNA polymerase II transcription regulator recruiting protein [Aureococcus anophagefferens]
MAAVDKLRFEFHVTYMRDGFTLTYTGKDPALYPQGAARSATTATTALPTPMMDDFSHGAIPASGPGLFSQEASQRRAWSRKEDDAIMRLVSKHGTKRWAVISQS